MVSIVLMFIDQDMKALIDTLLDYVKIISMMNSSLQKL